MAQPTTPEVAKDTSSDYYWNSYAHFSIHEVPPSFPSTWSLPMKIMKILFSKIFE